MSMLVGTRLWRPSATALILVLLVALMAPLAIAPTPARADVCDVPGISDVCDAPGDIASTASAVATGVADVTTGVIKGVVKGAKAIGTWAGDNADKIVKAAALAGIGIATWVACSRVLKAVAVVGAATATGVETAGAAAVPGGIAGAAGAAAACKLLRNGTKLILKVGKAAAKNGGKLANIAKLAAGAVGLAAIVYGTDHAAAWVLQNLLDFDTESAPNLNSGWLTSLRKNLNGVAGVLLLLATIIGMTLAGVMGRASDVGRIFTSMVSIALIIGVVGSILLAGLRVSDEVTSQTLRSPWGQQALGNWKDLGDSYAEATPKDKKDDPAAADATQTGDADAAAGSETAGAQAGQNGTPPADEKGPWPVRLLIAFFTALFGALVKLEMLIRDGLLYLLLAFGGLLLAAYPLPATRGIAQKFGMTLLGVVIAKPVIVITLLMGGAMMQSAAAGTEDSTVIPMLQGAGLMALSALMGSAILAWFSLHGASAMSGIGNRMVAGGGRRLGGSGGGSKSGGSADDDGPGGGGGDTPERSDPARDLAQGVGDRVNGGNLGQAGAVGAATMAGGAMSSRLQAAQAREGNGGGGGGAGGREGGGRPAGANSSNGAAASAFSDAPTEPMPIVGAGQNQANATPAGAGVGAEAVSTPGAQGSDDHGAGGAVGREQQAAGAAPGGDARSAAGMAAAAGAAAGGVGQSTGPQSPGSAGAVPAPATPAGASAPAPMVAGPQAVGSPTAAAPAAGGSGAPPMPSSVPSGPPIHDAPQPRSAADPTEGSNADAYAAFGAPAPGDAAAAFGDHAETVRAALDARPEVRA